jgi:F-type H+-transporting ATPase subunit delta
MVDKTTLARPYAKAIFEFALKQNALDEWDTHLSNLALATSDSRSVALIMNPETSTAMHIKLLSHLNAGQDKSDQTDFIENMLKMLANNKRLLLLPEIKLHFDHYRNDYEKTLAVHVQSFSPLSESQSHRLIEKLSQRLGRKVELTVTLDPSILGGAIIQAGELLVIDGSVQGQLKKLSTALAA